MRHFPGAAPGGFPVVSGQNDGWPGAPGHRPMVQADGYRRLTSGVVWSWACPDSTGWRKAGSAEANNRVGLIRRFQRVDFRLGQFQIERRDGVVEVPWLAGANNRRGDGFLLQQPRHGDLGA